MTELRKVSGPGSGFDRHVGRIIAVVVTAIVIAIVKPWGGPAAPAAVVPPPLERRLGVRRIRTLVRPGRQARRIRQG
jgi:hypothetical protein